MEVLYLEEFSSEFSDEMALWFRCDERLRAGVTQGGTRLMRSNQGERCYRTHNQSTRPPKSDRNLF